MRKQYILYIVIAILSLTNILNINNVSALDYSSNIGIGFTFNPTLSVSLSSSDLIIPNLVPGNTLDSNSINISVATNVAYGYTLSATVGDSTHDNSNLIHTNTTNVFSSIATDADLSNLTTDNTWGYNTSLDNGSTWSNYNGLSNSSNTTLLDKDSNISSNIDFRIGAKASPVQPSGTYINTITFTAVTKPTPMNLAESYFAHGKTRHNGYYTMQDMTTEICNDTEVIGEGSQTQLIDIRDNKVYWATKLADNHCWMTQNLDLDLDSNRTYTHWDTDLGWSDPNNLDTNATWQPDRPTVNYSGDDISGQAQSANPGDIYYYTSNSGANDIQYNSSQECENAGHNDCAHYHVGNYYNWVISTANNNNPSDLDAQYTNALNSICPANWRLPIATNSDKTSREFNILLFTQGVTENSISGGYAKGGFNNIRKAPLYLVRGGFILNNLGNNGIVGYYQTSTVESLNFAYIFGFTDTYTGPYTGLYRSRYRFSVRCLAR